ncbi:MAG: sulfatase-like hydrolase/transferase [Cyclobacteriaceae bacterium]
MKLASRFPRNRAGLFILFFVLAIGISTLLRIALLIKAWPELDSALSLPGIFFFGLLSDLLSTSYAAIPLALYLWLIPERFFKSRWNKYVLNSLFFVITFLLLFGAAAEWFFWDEFSGRFNFIAVDYLVYTTEVIGNITQSYPIGWLVFVITVLAIAGTYFLQPVISKASENYIPFKRRSILITAFAIVLYLFFLSFSNQYHRFSTNQYANELAGNGLYELFSAYRHNELNYDQFYSSVETRKAFSTLRDLLKTPESTFTSTDPLSLERKIQNTGPEKKLNVVLISVESFSADFMEHFGNKKHITPFLDSLAEHSLLFTNLYATGTRTVRGLEALSLCIPPTPGQSIVRRPDNEGLFSLGKVFQDKGYRSEYIYGGYGYFDNMNYFFSNNSYEVTDRTALKDSEIDYENIWGVADENLFTIATRNIDVHSQEKPVFAHIMTTSNHRPFTYPDGRIDIPSHTGRKGAVKYTDYAIGKFIREASKKPWFENTVFVIVADHCASSAGKTELPIEKYHIPMLIYSPSHVQPGVMSRLMSQIDIGPTLLGLLNFSYTSKFFGYDINKLEPGRERAFISTYQSLGYVKNNELIVLSPQFKTESFSFTASSDLHVTRDTTAVSEAIAWYQSASYAFRHGLLK